MISVLLKRKKNGALFECFAQGHADYAARGSDIVCSAATILLRTTLALLEKTAGIEIESNTSERGVLAFRIKSIDSKVELEQKLIFAADFLEEGFESLFKEYPRNGTFLKEQV